MYDRRAARLERRESYGGFDSENALKVHLYIQETPWLRDALEGVATRQGVKNGASMAARAFKGHSTPDGANYNVSSLRAAMRGMGPHPQKNTQGIAQ